MKAIKSRARASFSQRVAKRVLGFRITRSEPIFLRESNLPCGKRIAALVPHADDLALSAGRTVFALARKGKQNGFHSFVLMSGHRGVEKVKSEKRRVAIRRVEARQEAKALGVHSYFLRLPFYDTRKASARDVELVCRQMEALKPQLLFVPHSLDKSHPDHAYAHRLGLAVAKELVLRTGRPIEIWEVESPWEPIASTMVNTYVLNSHRASVIQAQALKVHESQMSRNPFDVISANEMFKRRMLLGEKLAGFGRRPKKIPDAEAFIRYRLVKKNGQVVRQPVAT